ncbi:triphosphoribosyl-dephospho-CoA synthase [Klebsiella pneumoniae]|nr:triphosphoribosyl-dephospho-CoA synthase [Klebsiella pneumoniae]MCM0903865.1 triphosphoribosyl-dephospho-CoA synthase [Klebsiella pneumoniae]MCM0917780.1 triphosphoribosyl-dephospho-CoA synthase [Klebsiella pneumoniae]MEB4476485.1 triphosphoribosyl-dephospho-CoA synthase [Klebsiella pneumoniae]
MNAEQTTGRVWNRRRTEKQRRLAEANMPGKVIPTDQLVSVLENLLAPGDRVVLEGNNQKQADFLSRMLAEVNPQKIHDLHMIMPSVGRSEHLDLFEKGIARKLDFSFSGTQSLRISQLLEDGLLEIGAIHTYIELYSRLYVDLSPNVALIAGYKADRKGNLYTGPSTEDTPALMERSARSLQPTFHALAEQSWRRPADIALRETVGRLGREGEAQMMLATGGVNTHRGAIWALGLLVSAVAMLGGEGQSQAIADAAAALARLPDGFAPKSFSKGLRASRRWQVPGAREEAQCGFPHITRLALPQLQHSRARGASEPQAQLDALMAIMTSLSDTCVLSRAGMAGLQAMQQGACEVLAAGGCASFAGRAALARLDAIMLALNASPGGAADLLAATLFLDRVAG